MPTKARVLQLVHHVEEGRILEAMDSFYHTDVSMQDNLAAPTVGRDANRTRLQNAMTTMQEVREHRARQVIVDGDLAVIHWSFKFTTTDGTRLDFDQLALQEWRGAGDDARIAHERFVFDSATIVAPSPEHDAP